MHVREKEFPAYLDNSLPAEKQDKLRQHFSECMECSRKLNEWNSLYDTIGLLEVDFELNGLEDRILQKIRKSEETVEEGIKPGKFIMNMVYTMVFLFIAGLAISPVTNMAGKSAQYVGKTLIHHLLNFVNEFKWQALDVISAIRGMDSVGWVYLLLAGITLIAGGAYFSFGRRLQKA